MRISDWSSDVCSSDLQETLRARLTITRELGGPSGGADVPALGHRAKEATCVVASQRRLSWQARRSRSWAPSSRRAHPTIGRASLSGKGVSVRVGLGGGRIYKKKNITFKHIKSH